MGIRTDKLSRSFTAFIEKQTLFFVATAGRDGRVNLSPKALDALKVVSPCLLYTSPSPRD